MVEYIRKLAVDLQNYADKRAGGKMFTLIRVLREELDRLDPRDFFPDAQYDFVIARSRMRGIAGESTITSRSYPVIRKLTEQIVGVLDKYGGEGNRAETRSFPFLSDPKLRDIIERDYKELSLILLPGGAWKSTVVIAGSILEAILYDVLTSDPQRKDAASASPVAPKRPRSSHVKDIDKGEWTLHHLIEVAADIDILPEERANTFDQVLRDYRNFVHPKKEIRTGHPCTEAEAYLAKGALDGICNHFEKNL